MIFNHLIEHEYSYIQTYQIHKDKKQNNYTYTLWRYGQYTNEIDIYLT